MAHQKKAHIFSLCSFLLMFILLLGETRAEGCSLREATNRTFSFFNKQNLTYTEKITPILERLSVLTAKAKNNSLPIGAQLSKPDLDEFEKLSETLLDLRIRILFSDNMLRDNEALLNVAMLSQMELEGLKISDNDPIAKYKQLKIFIWAVMPEPEFNTQVKENDCSIQAGLVSLQNASMSQMISAEKAKLLLSEIISIQNRYKIESKQGWLNEIPNGNDRQRAIELDRILTKQKALLNYISMLEKILIIQRASEEKYSYSIKELNKAKNKKEIENLGIKIEAFEKSGTNSEKKAYELLNYIGMKFPTQSAEMTKQMYNSLIERGDVPRR